MDSRHMANIVRTAAAGSILLLPSGIVLAGAGAGHHLFKHQPNRPIVSPACDPAWGYHATCWNRFPPIAACDQWTAGYSGSAGVAMPPGTSLPLQGSAPISILPGRGNGELVPTIPQQPAPVPHPGVPHPGAPHPGNTQFPLPPLPPSPQPRYEYERPVEGQQLPGSGAQSQSRYRIPTVSPALITEPSGIVLPAPMIHSGRYGSAVAHGAR